MLDEIELRTRCSECGYDRGTVKVSGLQRPVHCCNCFKLQYNASRAETGEEVTSLRSRIEIPSSQRARILERDSFRCLMCGKTPHDGVVLTVHHLVSQADFVKYDCGKPSDVNQDANLATACAECNAGKSSRSISVVALTALALRIAAKRERERKDGAE